MLRISSLGRLKRGVFAGGVLVVSGSVMGACGGGDGGGGGGSSACPANLVAGDLVITEIMGNPDGSDDGQEWWEIYNNRSVAVSLQGVTLTRSKEDSTSPKSHTIAAELIIEAGQYFVVGNILDEARPAHVDYGYGNDLGDLTNAAGRVAVSCGSTLVDEAIYTEVSDGQSRIFDGGQGPDSVVNDDLTQWCDSTATYDDSNAGSPKAANEACAGGGQTTCSDGGNIRDVVAPGAGDIVINEIMPNPGNGVDDDNGEWFELFVNADIDLNGLQIGKDPLEEPEMSVSSADCLPAAAGSYVLFAKNADSATNGGLPEADVAYDFSLSNNGGSLFVGYGGEILDVFAYTGSSDAASSQLDPRRQNAGDNDNEDNWCASEMAYGDGTNQGSPKAENAQCELPVPDGQCDDNGTLRDVVKPVVGDVVINEIMPNPAAVADGDGEWFELLVTADVDLNGLQMGKEVGTVADSISNSECVRVTAGSYVLFAKNTDTATNGGLPMTNLSFDFSLTNSNTALFVGIDDTVLDEVTYSSSSSGASLSLDPSAADETSNDNADNWCDGVDAYGDGDLGTPGAANPACGGSVGGMCNDGGTMRPIVSPGAGELVINEVMASPAGADGAQEWFEVIAKEDVDLNGLEITRDGSSQSFTIDSADCISATENQILVFARDADMATNGGLPQVDVVYGTVSLVGDGSIVLNSGSTLVDQFLWTSAPADKTLSLDPDFDNATDNDDQGNWCDGSGSYGAGGEGTPGAVNPDCGAMMSGDMCNDGGTMRAVVKPGMGQLVINEVMASPDGTDTDQEWFEVLATADVDLNGIIIGRTMSSQSFTISSSDCIRAGSGSFTVFARSAVTADNGGLPQVDVVYSTVSLTGDGSLTLTNSDMSLIDAFDWTGAPNGKTLSLQPGSANATDNDNQANWCSARDMDTYGDMTAGEGTPGAANQCM